MITQFNVCNFGLFHQAQFDPHPRFTVITGSTGAGKSLIFEAISLFCTKSQRRTPEPLHKDQPLTLTLHKKQKNSHHIFERKSFTNTVYKHNSARLTQTDVHALLAPTMSLFQQFNCTWTSTSHSHLLYQALCSTDARQQCAQVFNSWNKIKTRITQMNALLNDPEKSKTNMQNSIKELEDINTYAGEEEDLIKKQRSFMEYGRIRQLLTTLSACEELAQEIAIKSSRAATHLDHAQDLLQQESVDALTQALSFLEKGSQALSRETAEIAESHYTEERIDEELSRCNTRIHTLRTLAKKHQTTPQDLPKKLLELKEFYASMDSLEGAIEQEKRKLAQTQEELVRCSTTLKNQLIEKGGLWKSTMQNTLAQMDMVDTYIDIKITELSEDFYTAYGIYDPLVVIQTNNLHEPKPPHAILSGGELTRFTLAHQSLAPNTQEPITFLLDEIESGLSPSVCVRVGQLLRKLSQSHQVIVITHSPFIACFADKHYTVEKQKKGPHHTSHLTHVNNEASRIKELTRMLSGIDDTDASARTLILELLEKHTRA